MPIPEALARPLFHWMYPILRRRQGSPIPPIIRKLQPLPEDRRIALDDLLDSVIASGPNIPIDSPLPCPTIDLLHYACDWRGLVAHGSPLGDLQTIEPIRKSTDASEYGNRKQIFCSPDAAWAMWFAILDKDKYRVTRNGCIRIGSGFKRTKYYHFELREEDRLDPPFTNGTIYLCRAEDFPARHVIRELALFGGDAEEWGSEGPVVPLARIRVRPEDFPYLDQVQYCIKSGV